MLWEERLHMKKVMVASLLSGVFFITNQAHAARQGNPALQVGSVSIQEVEPTAAEIYEDLLNAATPTAKPAPKPTKKPAPAPAKKSKPAPAPVATPAPAPAPAPAPVINDNSGISDPSSTGSDAGFSFDLNDVMTIGQKIYDIVKENQPVVTIKRALVSVVPGGATDWTQLQGWKAPMTKVLEVNVKNLYGATTVYLRLKVTANYGGNARGVGHYLANVNMVPTQVSASWGYNVDVSVEAANGVNSGTSDDPIAGLGLDIRYHVHTLLSDLNGDQDYWLTGDGGLNVVQ